MTQYDRDEPISWDNTPITTLPTREQARWDGTLVEATIAGIPESALDWQHNSDRTPYANLKILVRELRARDDIETPLDEGVVTEFVFETIRGFGPHTIPNALDAVRKDFDGDEHRSAIWWEKRAPVLAAHQPDLAGLPETGPPEDADITMAELRAINRDQGNDRDASGHSDGDEEENENEDEDQSASTHKDRNDTLPRCDSCTAETSNPTIDGWRLCDECQRSVDRSTTNTDMTEEDLNVEIPPGIEITYMDGQLVAQQPPDPETGVRTEPEQLRTFHDWLVADAPEGYVPHYIRCEKGGKAPLGAPDTNTWKTPADRLSIDEAIDWMEHGGNAGIAGLASDDNDPAIIGDSLVDLDIDDPEQVDFGTVTPSLSARSRSRYSQHLFYFTASDTDADEDEDVDGAEDTPIPNIDCEAGEVRTDNQFVLAPGSHVPVALSDPDDPDLQDIPKDEREHIGRLYHRARAARRNDRIRWLTTCLPAGS